MSDRQAILDKLAELVRTASDLEDALDVARDEIERDWQTAEEVAQELIDDLELGTLVLDTESTEYDSAYVDGWEAAIEHIRQYYGI